MEYILALEGARRLMSWAEGEVADWHGGTGKLHERPSLPYAYDGRNRDSGSPDPELLAQVVDRIVAAVQPERIILFGSAACGTMGPYSDLDVLVVLLEPLEHRRVGDAIGQALSGIGGSVDVVLASPEDLERYGRSWCLVYCPALEEGRVLYEPERGCAA